MLNHKIERLVCSFNINFLLKVVGKLLEIQKNLLFLHLSAANITLFHIYPSRFICYFRFLKKLQHIMRQKIILT